MYSSQKVLLFDQTLSDIQISDFYNPDCLRSPMSRLKLCGTLFVDVNENINADF